MFKNTKGVILALASVFFLQMTAPVHAQDSKIQTKDIKNEVKKESSQIETPLKDVQSESYIVIDAKSGQILVSKNEKNKMYPASLTKILTTMLLLDNKKLEDVVTVSKESASIGETGISLKEKEEISVKDLAYAMMLYSANDASHAAAEAVSGSEEKFAELMNQKAKEIGAENSNFITANGLHNENHYTTALDLALITKEALKNNNFRDIIHAKNYTLNRSSEDSLKNIENKNKLLFENNNFNIIGGKTGFTTPAQNTLMEVAEKDGNEVIMILLKSPFGAIYNDASKILNYTFSAIKTKPIYTKESKPYNFKGIEVNGYLKNDINYISLNNEDINSSAIKVQPVFDNINLPIEKDQKIGRLDIFVNEKLYSSENIYSSEKYMVQPKKAFKVPSFLRNFLVLVGIVIIFKLLSVYMEKRNKKPSFKNKNIY